MSTIRVARAVACSVAVGFAVCQAVPASAAPLAAPPGSNFDLSVWELQEPTGSPGSPTTISPSRLEGGYTDQYFYTDSDGSMTFWDPENGVHTPHSSYSRSELREMTSSGKAAAWPVSGSHHLKASVKVSEVPDHVCVGQIHLAEGSGSTKPLVELYYSKNGDVRVGIEDSPSGGANAAFVGECSSGK